MPGGLEGCSACLLVVVHLGGGLLDHAGECLAAGTEECKDHHFAPEVLEPQFLPDPVGELKTGGRGQCYLPHLADIWYPGDGYQKVTAGKP